jgi:thiamine-monophosphate kinase
MPLTEFAIIKDYFQKSKPKRQDVILGIGDDAAILEPPPNMNIVVSMDTLNAGVHFFDNTHPYDLGYKSLAVSLSDLAAMGAKPAWVLLGLSLPEADASWLTLFAEGLFSLIENFSLQLVGGDTTRAASLSITTQVFGFIPKGMGLCRNAAKPDDLIYVTGTLGDAGLALQMLKGEVDLSVLSGQQRAYLINRLQRPSPRICEGLQLLGVANAAIDISDGLVADLGHILQQSQVGATIYAEQLPLSSLLRDHLKPENAWELALSAGDDYELCFTVPPHQVDTLNMIISQFECGLRCIGKIEQLMGLRILQPDGKILEISKPGYEHFGEE